MTFSLNALLSGLPQLLQLLQLKSIQCAALSHELLNGNHGAGCFGREVLEARGRDENAVFDAHANVPPLGVAVRASRDIDALLHGGDVPCL